MVFPQVTNVRTSIDAAKAAIQSAKWGNNPKSIYSAVNPVTNINSRQIEANFRQNYQGYTFNVAAGASVQTLTFPGDIKIIRGICASWDNGTTPGFNITMQMTVNNENIFNAVNVAILNINRNIPDPGYMPLNKIVAAQGTFTLTFANSTGATLNYLNVILVYC
jgi:hypothetical protein